MSFGLAKEDKFEIIATLREELHKKTKLEVLCENSSVITQLEKVDSSGLLFPGTKTLFLKRSNTLSCTAKAGL